MRAFCVISLGISVLILICTVSAHYDQRDYRIYQHCYQEGGACYLKNITCQEGYVIDVVWSVIGLSDYWELDGTRTNCSVTDATCYEEIDEPAENCTGLRECWIETCSNSTRQVIDCTDLDATNYMLINYSCVSEKTTPYPRINTTIGSTTSRTESSSSIKSTTSYTSTSSSTENTMRSTGSSISNELTTPSIGPSSLAPSTTSQYPPSSTPPPAESEDKTRALIIGLTTVSVILLIVCIILVVLLVVKKSTDNKVAPETFNEVTESRRESVVLRKASATFVKAKKNMSYLGPSNGSEGLDMDRQSDEEGESYT